MTESGTTPIFGAQILDQLKEITAMAEQIVVLLQNHLDLTANADNDTELDWNPQIGWWKPITDKQVTVLEQVFGFVYADENSETKFVRGTIGQMVEIDVYYNEDGQIIVNCPELPLGELTAIGQALDNAK